MTAPATPSLPKKLSPELQHKQVLVATLMGGAIATNKHGKTPPASLLAWAKELAEQIIREVNA